MSRPSWSEPATSYDVLVMFRLLHFQPGGSMAVTSWHRFAVGRTVLMESEDVWEGGSTQGIFTGAITSISPLRFGFGSDLRPKISYPTVTLNMARDGSSETEAFLDALKATGYGARTTGNLAGIFLVGKGTDLDISNDLFFVGRLDPNSVRLLPDSIDITLTDRTKASDSCAPIRLVSEYVESINLDVDGIDPAWEGKPLPILFGPWNTGQEYQIEVPCIDTRNDLSDFKFVLGDPLSLGLGMVSSGGSGVPGNRKHIKAELPDGSVFYYQYQNFNSSTGIFEAADSKFEGDISTQFQWEEGVRFYVRNPIGLVDGQGNPITNPADIWKYILTECASNVSISDLDSTSYSEVWNYFDTMEMKGRAWLAREQSIASLIEQLCYEFGFFSYVAQDQFKLAINAFYRRLAAEEILYGCHFAQGRFETQVDPSSWTFGKIHFYYEKLPKDDEYASAQTFPEGTTSGRVHTVEADWIYDRDTAVTRASYLCLAHSNPAVAIKGTAIKAGMDMELTDLVAVEHQDAHGETYQIFNINLQLDQGLAELTAFTLAWDFYPGSWTAESAPDFVESASMEKETLGFWTDDNGLCNPLDQDSDYSNWT